MTPCRISAQLIIGLLILGCNSKPKIKVEKVTLTSVDTISKVPSPPPPTGLKVSGYLVYDDGSISSFDALNDKTKALWNTIIGAGDAEKPSTSTKIRLSGQLDSLRVKILNGKKKAVDQMLPKFRGDYEFTIKNTGCQIVKIYVTKRGRAVFADSIEFHCGE
jgi:hypothetical protein